MGDPGLAVDVERLLGLMVSGCVVVTILLLCVSELLEFPSSGFMLD